jgi:hypothetical protein
LFVGVLEFASTRRLHGQIMTRRVAIIEVVITAVNS